MNNIRVAVVCVETRVSLLMLPNDVQISDRHANKILSYQPENMFVTFTSYDSIKEAVDNMIKHLQEVQPMLQFDVGFCPLATDVFIDWFKHYYSDEELDSSFVQV